MPASAFASVSISEIAWMGTTTSPNDEWIELASDSSESLTGWTLSATDGTPSITLSGSISANGYFLLERTDDSTVPNVTADQIFTGALGNEGEMLVLKDASGAIIDTVSGTGGWPAGDATTRETMQWGGSSWITAPGTPGAANAAGEQGNEEEEDDTDDNNDDEQDSDEDENNETSGSAKVSVIKVDPDPIYAATVLIPDFTVRGVAAHFESVVTKDKVLTTKQGRYRWSMGDGTSYAFEKNTSLDHIYDYPGTYVVVFQYYSNDMKDKPDSIHRKTVTVIDNQISISHIDEQGGVTLKNETSKEIDIGRWSMTQGDDIYYIPKYTYIASKSTLIVPHQASQFDPGKPVTLFNPEGKMVNVYPRESVPAPVTRPLLSQKRGNVALPVQNNNDEMVPETVLGQSQTAQAARAGITFGTPFLLFVILVLVAIAGYSVYVYGFPRRQKMDEGTPLSEEYDLDDILRGS